MFIVMYRPPRWSTRTDTLGPYTTLCRSRDPIGLVAWMGVFARAMRVDMSDPTRETRRSDIAFWLHLPAAPLIAHPVFQLLGVLDADVGSGTAIVVVALYLVFAFVALAVDRRALLVSSQIGRAHV